jgi:uncharacterized membrane protein YccF (DUF307 family)
VDALRILGNIIWVVFGGELIFVCYLIYGLLLCITIIGIPFGIQLFKIGCFALWPFGHETRDKPHRTGFFSLLFNIIWILAGGFEFAILHLIIGLVFMITVIGFPFGLQHIKLAKLALIPFGQEIVKTI